MHVNDGMAAGAFMQVVDILRYKEKFAGKIPFQPRERLMCRVRLDLRQARPAFIVEGVNTGRITRESLGRCHVFDANARPDAAFVAKGRNARFCRNSGAGQNDDGARDGELLCANGLMPPCRRR